LHSTLELPSSPFKEYVYPDGKKWMLFLIGFVRKQCNLFSSALLVVVKAVTGVRISERSIECQ
jgi:hypothetical protein